MMSGNVFGAERVRKGIAAFALLLLLPLEVFAQGRMNLWEEAFEPNEDQSFHRYLQMGIAGIEGTAAGLSLPFTQGSASQGTDVASLRRIFADAVANRMIGEEDAELLRSRGLAAAANDQSEVRRIDAILSRKQDRVRTLVQELTGPSPRQFIPMRARTAIPVEVRGEFIYINDDEKRVLEMVSHRRFVSLAGKAFALYMLQDLVFRLAGAATNRNPGLFPGINFVSTGAKSAGRFATGGSAPLRPSAVSGR